MVMVGWRKREGVKREKRERLTQATWFCFLQFAG